MSKFIKLSRLIVVLFTLLALGAMTALPVAYAGGNTPNLDKYCQAHNPAYPSGSLTVGGSIGSYMVMFGPLSGGVATTNNPLYPMDDVCREQYPGTTRYDLVSDSCI